MFALRSALLIIITLTTSCGVPNEESRCERCLTDINELRTKQLRARDYGSSLKLFDNAVAENVFFLEFESDGLRQFARIDTPDDVGHKRPIVIFAHGWVGADNAPNYDFSLHGEGMYSRLIEAYRQAGFLVVTPGYRGHGVIEGQPAQGIEYLHAYDNGSYLSPMLYAIDVLNLTAALDEAGQIPSPLGTIQIDTNAIHLVGHSQGGDVALTAAAVTGDNANLSFEYNAVSIWAGCFTHRFLQAEMYGPMGSSLEAFISGDGSWNSTAVGSDGEVNPNFTFGWPADWIGTVDTSSDEWTWQEDAYGSSRDEAIRARYDQMYEVLKAHQVIGSNVSYSTSTENDRTEFHHPTEVQQFMSEMGGYDVPEWIKAPINFNFSDRDYYSIPEWNNDLSQRINQLGGQAHSYEYTGTNHSLEVSSRVWYSPEGTKDGFTQAIERDIQLFRTSIQ